MKNLKDILETTPDFKEGETVFYLPTQLFFKIGRILISGHKEEISFYDDDDQYIDSDTLNDDGTYFQTRSMYTEKESKELGFLLTDTNSPAAKKQDNPFGWTTM